MPVTGSTTPGDKWDIVYGVGVLPDEIEERAGQETSGLSIDCEVAAADRSLWFQDMLGWAIADAASPTGMRRVLPERCGLEDYEDHYCMQLDRTATIRGSSVDEVLLDEDWPTFERLRYRASFVRPLYAILEDDPAETDESYRYCIWERKLTAENEKIPGGGFHFADNQVVEQVAIRVGRCFEIRCTWVDVPEVPLTRITNCINRINNAALTLNDVTYATETVLFKGVDEKRRRNAYGGYTYDITYTFLVRADGRTWNELWRVNAAGNVVYEAPTDAAGNKIYSTVSLAQLWRL